MFVSTIIWVESIIETVNKRYTLSAGFPTQNGGQSSLATIFADGIVNQVPIVNQCYQIVSNLAPARGDAPARLEITNLYIYISWWISVSVSGIRLALQYASSWEHKRPIFWAKSRFETDFKTSPTVFSLCYLHIWAPQSLNLTLCGQYSELLGNIVNLWSLSEESTLLWYVS